MIFHVAGAFDLVGHEGAALEFVEDARDAAWPSLGESTLRRPRWAMPSTISFTPSAPPRLMICSSAGTIASPPSRPKRLVPVYLTSRNFSKPSASISLLQDRALALAVKIDLLVGAFDARLEPGLFRRDRRCA